MPFPYNSPDRLEIKNRVKLCLGDEEGLVVVGQRFFKKRISATDRLPLLNLRWH